METFPSHYIKTRWNFNFYFMTMDQETPHIKVNCFKKVAALWVKPSLAKVH